MPIIRTETLLLYFAHVPKCGGTGIEGLLTQRFGQRARGFLDPGHFAQPPETRWGRNSPQHVDAATMARLFPSDFFDATFAMVRHPVLRLRSVYLYHRDVEGAIAPDESFGAWLDALPTRRHADPFHLDNHARPICEMVPEGARVFRLEEGVGALVGWLDEITGTTGRQRDVTRRHSLAERLGALGKAPRGPEVIVTPDHVAKVAALDPQDFDRFGYPEDPADMARGLAPLPAMT